MKVTLRRTGGFAGTTMRYEVDSADAELQRLTAAAMAEPYSRKPPLPDSFTYSVTMTDDDGTTTQRAWGEHDLTDAARALIDRITERSETR
jgi:hypothetical protein